MRNATNIDVFSSLGPTAEEICRQVERILASEEFHAPKRARNFLEFVVNETLAGRSGFLKAFTIANVVFGREASFDPQNDPVVRIEAGRIRKALERYYLVAGRADDVIITVPKGGYVPHFEYTRDASVPSPTEGDPANERIAEFADQSHSPRETRGPPIAGGLTTGLLTILILPLLALASAFFVVRGDPIRPSPSQVSPPTVAVELFAESSSIDTSSDIAGGLRDDIIGRLAQLDDIVVVADPPAGDHAAAADYALQGNVQMDGSRLRSVARLVRQADGVVIWANNFDADLRAENKLGIQTNIARQIAGAITQAQRAAIFQADTAVIARAAQKADLDAHACTHAYDSYLQAMTAQSHGAVRDCLQRATRRTPDNATSWALLSLVYLDEMRFRYRLGTPSSAEPLALATASAQRAASLAPDNPRVLRAVMLVNFFRGDIDKALAAGTAAYAADPHDVEVAGEYGLRLAMSGKWQSGCELISIALDKNAGPRGSYEAGMAMCAFMKGDIEAAEQWSRLSDLDFNPMRHLALLSILGAAGKIDEARLERDWLQTHAPSLMTNIRQEISLRLQRSEDQERFFAGLRAAGVPVDLPSGG